MSLGRKNPNKDLRNYYNLYLQAGLAITLLILIGLFKIPFNPSSKESFQQPEQQTVKMEDIVQTKQEETPPPPPAPQVPVAVPNDEVISDAPVNLNAELDLNAPLNVPPPPPPAQDQKKTENQVFIVVQHMPKLIGGLAKLQQSIHYPDLARKAGIEGRVYVQFVVDEHGNVVDPKVIRGIGGGCDQEALRAVSHAKFVPGMQRGRPVKVRYSLPVVFKLQD